MIDDMKKRYYNQTTQEWYTEGQSMTRRVDNGVFSGIPSVEQLTEWGFAEWVEPEPTPEQLLERAKQDKIAELEAYDDSDAINGFDIVMDWQIMSAWLTPDKRADYKNSIDAAELLGMEEVHPVFNGVMVTMPIQRAKLALAQVQIYANQCYGVTETHRENINNLSTIEAVEEYDFTTGYPNRIVFNL
jgi:hypothetical protein